MNDYSAKLLAALRRGLSGWDCAVDGDRVAFTQSGGPYRPPRRALSWAEILATMENACAARGISRGRLLPLRGLRDADLTFSAVQALDPYLKRKERFNFGVGFLPQPVVRFTRERDKLGALRPGFATSFVNTSLVQPIASIDEHAALIDSWIGVLSRLGLHSHHTAIRGSLRVWQRPPVCGITLRFEQWGVTSGDAVLLWNAEDPTFLASDIGSGLERLQWLLTQLPWPRVVFGELADHGDLRVLDVVRTATLIIGSGIRPASHGVGSGVRRLLRTAGAHPGLGMSRVVRSSHRFWTLFGPLLVPWPEVCRVVDTELSPNPE